MGSREPGDDDAFDCEACEYRQITAGLTQADYQALEAYRFLSKPVVASLKLTPVVLQILGIKLTRSDARAWLDRLDLIHQYHATDQASATTGPKEDDE